MNTNKKCSDSVLIRPAVMADIPELVELLRELFSLEIDFSFDPTKQQRGLELLIPQADSCVLVAELFGIVVGMCSAQTVISTAQGTRSGWVEDVVVSDSCRGKGIGGKLMTALEQWARDNNVTRLQLLADKDNTPALTFYRKNNWQEMNCKPLRKYL